VLHRPRLGSALASVYRVLTRIDQRLAGTTLGWSAANSLVVLARKPDAR